MKAGVHRVGVIAETIVVAVEAASGVATTAGVMSVAGRAPMHRVAKESHSTNLFLHAKAEAVVVIFAARHRVIGAMGRAEILAAAMIVVRAWTPRRASEG